MAEGFDPTQFQIVAPRRFEDLEVGKVFRAPSRTLTAPDGDTGLVTTAVTVHNQDGALVLEGRHTYRLRAAPSAV